MTLTLPYSGCNNPFRSSVFLPGSNVLQSGYIQYSSSQNTHEFLLTKALVS